MSLYENLQHFEEQKKAQEKTSGRSMSHGGMAYSAEAERGIGQVPIIAKYRVALQGANGKFLFKVNDDGTRTSGSFYIDSFGRFISY